MAIEKARAGANYGLSILSGGICHVHVRRKSRAATDGLSRQAPAKVEGQVGIELPMILDELCRFRGRSAQNSRTLKGDSLGNGAILSEQFDGVR